MAIGSGIYLVWKTAAQFGDVETYLELDDQIARYVYALRRAMGLSVRGFIYHEQRKDYPRPPAENKSLRLGRKFSVNKMQATDYATYLETVSTRDKEAFESGLYDDFLEFLKNEGTVYYRRFTVYKSDYNNVETEKNLVLEAVDMVDPNLRIYPQPGRFTCSGCAFQLPCMGQNSGHDYEYTLSTLYEKKEPYYRRNRLPTTEKRGD